MWTLHVVRYFTGHPSIWLVFAALDPRTVLNASGLDNKACGQDLADLAEFSEPESDSRLLSHKHVNVSLSSQGHHPEQIHLVVSVFIF